MASHLGPWLLGTQKNTGTVAGVSVTRNMGATVVSQQVALVAGSAVTCVVPAGSLILNAYTYMTTGAAGTPNLTVGGTIIGTLSTAAGQNALTANTTNVGTMANVGTTDATVSFTATAASAGTLVITYVVRNSDGSIAPTYNQA
jgi:hypothetical protein